MHPLPQLLPLPSQDAPSPGGLLLPVRLLAGASFLLRFHLEVLFYVECGSKGALTTEFTALFPWSPHLHGRGV